MSGPGEAIAFLAGGSHPGDGYIEEALASRIEGTFVPYASLLRTYQGGQHVEHIETRVETLGRLLADRDEASFVLMGRSSGARAITKFASLNPPKLRGVVCLGYPFRHPEHPPELDRVAHLAEMPVPTLILQGSHDVYGGPEAVATYALSPRISVAFVDADHGLHLSPQAWDDVAARIRGFIAGLPPLGAKA